MPSSTPTICVRSPFANLRRRPELLEQADGRLEDAAGLAHVLAEENDVGVARHFLRDAADDRVPVGQFRHAKPPSA